MFCSFYDTRLRSSPGIIPGGRTGIPGRKPPSPGTSSDIMSAGDIAPGPPGIIRLAMGLSICGSEVTMGLEVAGAWDADEAPPVTLPELPSETQHYVS